MSLDLLPGWHWVQFMERVSQVLQDDVLEDRHWSVCLCGHAGARNPCWAMSVHQLDLFGSMMWADVGVDLPCLWCIWVAWPCVLQQGDVWCNNQRHYGLSCPRRSWIVAEFHNHRANCTSYPKTWDTSDEYCHRLNQWLWSCLSWVEMVVEDGWDIAGNGT